MIRRVWSELKIMGADFFILSAAFTAAIILLSAIAGELLPFYPVSFEVFFPFYAAVAVGEWGKTRADSNYDLIAAQSSSLFRWVLLRYVIPFGLSTFFALFSMVFSSVFRYEFPLWELLLIYCPPAFFLSSLCALFGIHCTWEHVAASACGILWLLLLLARSLPAIPGAAYIYPFIRYAGEQNSVWLWNKGIVSALGLSLWGILYLMCRRTGTKKS